MDMYNIPIATASIAAFKKIAYEQLEVFEAKVLALAEVSIINSIEAILSGTIPVLSGR